MIAPLKGNRKWPASGYAYPLKRGSRIQSDFICLMIWSKDSGPFKYGYVRNSGRHRCHGISGCDVSGSPRTVSCNSYNRNNISGSCIHLYTEHRLHQRWPGRQDRLPFEILRVYMHRFLLKACRACGVPTLFSVLSTCGSVEVSTVLFPNPEP